MIYVVIADDHELFAEGLETLLHSTGRYKVIDRASNGKKLLQVLNSKKPDILLVDINMPLLKGTDAALQIRKLMPYQKIVFITMYHDNHLRNFCRENNINGYLLKNTTAAELTAALDRVMAGEQVHVQPPGGRMPQSPRHQDAFLRQMNLSKREWEIIGLIREGHRTKGIAAMLSLSELTVETHRKNIFRKLKISSAVALLRLLEEHDL